MLGYREYWTTGFTAYQWWSLFNRPYVTEFDFINIGMEKDRMDGTLSFWFHLLGLRFWLNISVSDPDPIMIEALKAIAGDLNAQNKETLPQDQ